MNEENFEEVAQAVTAEDGHLHAAECGRCQLVHRTAMSGVRFPNFSVDCSNPNNDINKVTGGWIIAVDAPLASADWS